MRVRQHVNPLKLEYLIPRTNRLPVPAGREVEVELGCAEAHFLFERAAQGAARDEIGLEIRVEHVEAVNARARAEAPSVRAFFANISVDLPYLFAPASVARLFVNFPDPWWKKKHHKRRVVDDALVEACVGVLRPGGELFFQSDVFELALDAMEVFERTAGLVNRAGPWTFWKEGNPYGAKSRRERTCEDEGLPIWRMLYDRAA